MSTDEDRSQVPRDAVTVEKLLASMGVKDYEPQVVQQLLDCMYRHISDILQDAEAYRQRMINPAGEISLEDLLLAIQARETHTFMQLPPQSVLAEMASRQNKQPLPELSDKPGLQIPVNSLTGPSYQLEVTADPMLPSEPNAASLSETQSGSSLRGGNKQSAQLQIKLGESARAEGDWMDAA